MRWKAASNFYWLYCIFVQLLLSKYDLYCLSDLCPLFMIISTGQRDDTISSESRRHRHSGEESHSPKAANGTAVRLASVSSSSCESNLALPKLVSEVNQELLTSGAVILPGRGWVIRLILAGFILTQRLVLQVSHAHWDRQTHSVVLRCMFIIFHSVKNALIAVFFVISLYSWSHF